MRKRLGATSMKKKILAAAIAGLGAPLALPAHADIKITDKFYPAIVMNSGAQASDASTPTSTFFNNGAGVIDQTTIDTFNSWIRFSGEADAGGGIKGWFQVEQALDFDVGNTAFWANRNSAMGIKGGFGNVFLGRWDTPYKQLHFPTNMFGLSSGAPISNSGLLSRTPYSGGSSRASFHRRQNNMIQYWSPTLAGFTAKVMWGTEETKTPGVYPTRTSASLEYETGPLLVGVAYEVHNNLRGATAGLSGGLTTGVSHSTDTGLDLTAVYKIKSTGTEIGGDIESLTYKDNDGAAGAVEEYKRAAWRVGVEQTVGPVILGFNYGMASEGSCSLFGGGACSTDGFGATQMSIGGMYHFSKALGAYAWYTQINNDNSASYSFLGAATPTGADPTAVALGLYGRF
jgi:predicted porin